MRQLRQARSSLTPTTRAAGVATRRSFGALLLMAAGCARQPAHGSLSSLSVAKDRDWKACPHQVPESVCVRCHPALSAKFKARNDWCPEHDVPESQCLACHPDLDFSPPLAPPADADVKALVEEGEDLPALEPHLAAGKVTVFDFHAIWCPPCRKVDEHVYALLRTRKDLALRKIDVGNWDTPVAARWLSDVSELPFLVIFDKRGNQVATVAGAKLNELDAAISAASR